MGKSSFKPSSEGFSPPLSCPFPHRIYVLLFVMLLIQADFGSLATFLGTLVPSVPVPSPFPSSPAFYDLFPNVSNFD